MKRQQLKRDLEKGFISRPDSIFQANAYTFLSALLQKSELVDQMLTLNQASSSFSISHIFRSKYLYLRFIYYFIITYHKTNLSVLPFKRLSSNRLNRDTKACSRGFINSSTFSVEIYAILSSCKFSISIFLHMVNSIPSINP